MIQDSIISDNNPGDLVIGSPKKQPLLRVFLFLTYLSSLILHVGCLWNGEYRGALAPIFVGVAFVVYSALYLFPAVIFIASLNWLLNRPGIAQLLKSVRISPGLVVALTAVLLTASLHVLLYADRFIYKLYGFHLNGFVWNLVFTRGGIDSLGGGTSTTLSFTLIILGFAVLQSILFAMATRWPTVQRASMRILNRRWTLIALFLLLALFEQITYGLAYLRGYPPVLLASNALPVYFPISFNRLAENFGVKVEENRAVSVSNDTLHLQYPRHPLIRDPAAKNYNIVWMVSESLRADMLDPKIMPNAWAAAQQGLWLRNHYSGGNGTRMGVFSMFYGLYGYYWFPFLTERRGPVLIDELIDRNYQMDFYTGAAFSYPEFDQTVFTRIDSKKLHENIAIPMWKRDEENVTDIIDFVGKRDPARPFFAYIFFESPHANYHFPKEAVIANPYGQDLNYATMDVQKDILLIKNRYINACHYLDSQIGRLLDMLRDKKMLDSTIVIITGDHGEEFMEKGRWGHNSEFTQEQIRTPCVLLIPGQKPLAVDDMTSHLDLPPTVLRRLGITNPLDDFCLGLDLLGDRRRDFIMLADWNTLAYIDGKFKVTLPWKVFGFAQQQVKTLDDRPVTDDKAFFEANRDKLSGVIRSLKQFSK